MPSNKPIIIRHSACIRILGLSLLFSLEALLAFGQVQEEVVDQKVIEQFVAQLSKKANGHQSIDVPIDNHQFAKYVVQNSPRFPSEQVKSGFQTFHGYSVEDSNNWLSIILRDKKLISITRYDELSYATLEKGKKGFLWISHESSHSPSPCFTQNKVVDRKPLSITKNSLSNSSLIAYKIAISTTPEFSAIHGTTKADITSAILNYLNQVNNIYERELGITLVLVENNEKLIFLDANNDPFPDQAGAAIVKNAEIINDSIGLANYDIGHLLTLGGGGIANVRVACTDRKAYGASGFEEVSSFFKLLAHEIGHQIGAGHTWNSCTSGLNSTQRSASSAMEPGSGTTIMSYAGLCGANNIDIQRDPYFHIASIEQIAEYTRTSTGNTCGQVLQIPNSPPTIINIDIPDKKFPIATPFTLFGAAEDLEDEALSYTWDEVDQGPAADLGVVDAFNPIFKFEVPSASPMRNIPDLVSLANHIDDPSQELPTFSRDVEFKFVVRDNHSGNGNITSAFITLSFDDTAGPFEIAPETTLNEWFAKGHHPVVWNVANTTKPEIDAQSVHILIDYDGSLTFKDTLAVDIKNDGLHYIQLPDTISNQARLMVKAADHIFFDITEDAFHIIRPTEKDFQVFTDTTSVDFCDLEDQNFLIHTSNINFYNNLIRFTPLDVPSGMNISFSENDILAGSSTTVYVNFDSNIIRKQYDLKIQAFAPNGTAQTITFTINIQPNNLEPTTLINPIIGETFNRGNIEFSWTPIAASHQLEVSNSPEFIPENQIATIQTNLSETEINIPYGQAYYWKVNSSNGCSDFTTSEIGFFGIKEKQCQQNASDNSIIDIGADVDSVSKTIEVTEDIIINEIRIQNIKGHHTFVGDLSFLLIAPDGTRLNLLSNQCSEDHNFNISFSDQDGRLRCPLNQEGSFAPESSLQNLKGTSAKGTWSLKILDLVPGDGGNFESWSLEICALTNSNNPQAIVQDTLKLRPASSARLKRNTLEFQDMDNAPSDIRYTLLTTPSKGSLKFSDKTLHIGESFTQADINAELIEYQHSNSIEEQDQFSFAVTDGQGYISEKLQQFVILQNNVGLPSPIDEFGIEIFPNPADHSISLRSNQPILHNLTATIYNLKGQTLKVKMIPSGIISNQFNLQNLVPGLYFIQLTSSHSTAIEKIIIQR